MPRSASFRHVLCACLLFCLPFSQQAADAHGSVSAEDDLCAIKIGYFKAHFKIYLPRTKQHKDYCEDIPEKGEAVFVMEYMHSGLGEIPIDFRIIRDVTGMGKFARWEDVQEIGDLDAVTEFYQSASVVPDVFTVLYQFDEPGDYIGIVNATPPDGRAYTAVFPFEVGFTGFGYWPLILVLAIALQLNYWYMNGRLTRGGKRRFRPLTVAPDS